MRPPARTLGALVLLSAALAVAACSVVPAPRPSPPRSVPPPAASAAEPESPLLAPFVDESARRWVAAHREAHGGDRWTGVRVLKGRFVLERDGRTLPMTVWRMGRDRLRQDVEVDGGVRTTLVDGGRGWQVDEGRAVELAIEVTTALLLQVDDVFAWRDPWSRFDRIETIGPSTAADRIRLRGSTGGGASEEWILDAESAERIEIVRPIAGVGEERVLRSDFRAVAGLTFAHRVEIDHGRTTTLYRLQAVEIDPPVPDGWFQPPGG